VYPIAESVGSHEIQNIGGASESQAGQIGKRPGDTKAALLADFDGARILCGRRTVSQPGTRRSRR
jgi:hypothetical protein